MIYARDSGDSTPWPDTKAPALNAERPFKARSCGPRGRDDAGPFAQGGERAPV